MSNFTPVRRGLFYGSLGCCSGRLCTVVAFDQASIEARELADRLGAGWEPHVWENLGWHYEIILAAGENTLRVHPSTTGSHIRGGWKVRGYSAAFNHQFWRDASTPEAAVIAVITAIREQYESLGAVLAIATGAARAILGEEVARG